MIIDSLLDTDFYKLTMMQTVLHQFPSAMVEYKFQCRNPHIDLRPYADELRQAIEELATLSYSREELDYLRDIRFFKSDFVEFLRIFRFNPEFVSISTKDKFELSIKGPWLHTILFEIPLLALINEIYYRHQDNYKELLLDGEKRLHDKIKMIVENTQNEAFVFSEFGTRRRFSKEWQGLVLKVLKNKLGDQLAGTSNVYFAKKFQLRPIGTMAHEYLQACQTLGPRLIYSQQFAFERWAQEYRGELGIILTDVYGLEAFLKDFDLYFCKLFDGVRHDSGDPFIFGEKMIAHYEAHRVDPRTKTLVFSDNLNFDIALQIYH
ncbi:MAG: nicotinate phosphoribosyltransferase, partial [Gammaproteobacteria bacterium]|nr:nicotinate phosphoribosyltransferase [Gammaproteobacteria bacterium]